MSIYTKWLDTYGTEASYHQIVDFAKKHSTQATSKGMHLNTPYPLDRVGFMLVELDEYQDDIELSEPETFRVNTRLIDLGCGSGHIVALASHALYYAAEGVDVNEDYVEAANELIRSLGLDAGYATVHQVRAEDVPLDSYDVIVLNRLYVGPLKQTELEKHVQDSMQSGSYLMQLNNLTTPHEWPVVVIDGLSGRVVRKP